MGASSNNKRTAEATGSPANRRAAVTSSRKRVADAISDMGSSTESDESLVSSQATGDNGGSSPPNRGSDETSSPVVPVYESPLRRVRCAVERGAARRVIETARDLKAFIEAEDPQGRGVPASVAATVSLRMRVVWTSFDSCSTGVVARLHLVDKCAEDSVEEMHEVFKDGYAEKKSIVDSELVTASLYGVGDDAAGLPTDGSVILVSRLWSLKLFAKHSCQLSTGIDAIRVET